MKTFESNKTITELGIDTTRKFVVVDGTNIFKEGEILTLFRDDDSIVPFFINQDGKIGCIELSQIAYYEEPTVDISGTNEEMKEGDYVYVSDESEEGALKCKNKRILLKKCSDGVVCVEEGNEEDYLNGEMFETTKWDYAVPIPKLKTITLEVTEEQEREINKYLTR